MLDIFMRQGPEIKRIYQTYRRILRWLKAQGLEVEEFQKLSPHESLEVTQGVAIPRLKLKISVIFYIPNVGNLDYWARQYDKGFVTLEVEVEGDGYMSWCSFEKKGPDGATLNGEGWLSDKADELNVDRRRQPDFMLELVKRVVERSRK